MGNLFMFQISSHVELVSRTLNCQIDSYIKFEILYTEEQDFNMAFIFKTLFTALTS